MLQKFLFFVLAKQNKKIFQEEWKEFIWVEFKVDEKNAKHARDSTKERMELASLEVMCFLLPQLQCNFHEKKHITWSISNFHILRSFRRTRLSQHTKQTDERTYERVDYRASGKETSNVHIHARRDLK